MATTDYARCEALMENIQASVRVIAVGQAALIERFDTWFGRLKVQFDQVAIQLAVSGAQPAAIDATLTAIGTTLTAMDAKLEAFSVDTRSRFERIGAHAGMGGTPGPGKHQQRSSAKRRKEE